MGCFVASIMAAMVVAPLRYVGIKGRGGGGPDVVVVSEVPIPWSRSRGLSWASTPPPPLNYWIANLESVGGTCVGHEQKLVVPVPATTSATSVASL